MDRYRALAPLAAAWQQAVAPPLSRHAHPAALRDGILTVNAESSVWASLLRNSHQSLVTALRDKASLEVRSLRIRIAPPAPTHRDPPAAERDAQDPDLERRLAELRRALD